MVSEVVCLHPRHSKPRLKSLSKAHSYLCAKSPRYHAWHHHPHHQKIHMGVLTTTIVLLVSVIVQTFLGGMNAQAATNTWNFGSSADYTYSDSSVEVTSNTARLKAGQYADDANTQALWHFDESSGTAADSAGNSNTATLQNSATYAAARAGNGLSLNGSKQYASAGDSATLSLSSNLTLEAYTKFSSAFDATDDISQYIVDKGNYKLYFDQSDGKLKFELENNTAKSWDKVGEDVNSSWVGSGLGRSQVFAEYGGSLYVGLYANPNGARVYKYSGSGAAWTKVAGDGVNGSWMSAGYEGVFALEPYNSQLCAGLGDIAAGASEVWCWNDTAWTKIGGDGVNGLPAGLEGVQSLESDGTYLYAGVGRDADEGDVWRWNGTTWTQIGGDGLNSSWDTSYEFAYSLVYAGSTLYAGLGSSAGDAEVWSWNGTTWTQIGGDTLKFSWANSTYEQVASLASDGTYLYAGLGSSAGDAEVWRYTIATDTWGGALIGGDGTGWTNSTYEQVLSLNIISGTLYASLGTSAGDGEVWSWNGTTWTQIGGDTLNSGWDANSSKESAYLGTSGSSLVAGTGSGTNDAETWLWNGSAWSWIGGKDWTSWGAAMPSIVQAMAINDGKLYVGLGGASKEATVWEYNGSTWAHVGGNYNSSWDDSIEYVYSLASYNNKIYAGLGNSAGDGDLWEYNGSNDWTQIGGDGLNSGWAAAIYEAVLTMTVYQSELYAGLGISDSADAEVWKYNGSAWAKVGGDSTNSSWAGGQRVNSLVADGTYLYAGLGTEAVNYAYSAQVWRWDGATWTIIGGSHYNNSWAKAYLWEAYTAAVFNNKAYFGFGYFTGTNSAVVWEYDGTNWQAIGGNGLNSSWTVNTYEVVLSMASNSNYLYVGLGSNAGDAEVWRYNGTTWSKIGGDALNSSWADSTYESVYSLAANDTTLYAGLGNSADDGEVWSWNGSSWSQIGGDSLNSGWTDADNITGVGSLLLSGSTLYIGTGWSTGTADVWSWNGSSWSQIGGDTLKSSWASSTYEGVYNLVTDGTYLYAGLGNSGGDAEVWRYNIATDTWGGALIGGDGTGWAAATYEAVCDLAVSGSTLYASLCFSANDAEVWSWNGTTWTQIGGDSVNSSWGAGYEYARSLLVWGSNLYVGLGNSFTDARIWRWNGTTWTQIGGTGAYAGPDDLSSIDQVTALAINQGLLYAGLGNSGGDAEVWSWNGTTWTKVGGDSLNSSWTVDYEYITSMTSYSGLLYVGLGNNSGDAEVWSWNGTIWTQIGGDSLNSGWTSGYETVYAMAVYSGKLHIGTGTTAGDAEVWAYGANSVLASTTSSWTTGWYHVAATYDGSTMRLYVNGTEEASLVVSISLADLSTPLYVGSALGNANMAEPLPLFTGTIDEVRISNTARSSFTIAPYASTRVTIQPNNSLDDADVLAWSGFAVSETVNGGTITYRLSDDAGTSWKYYTAGAWTASSSTTQANTAADVNTNIGSLTVTNDGVLWQAVLLGSGDQVVTLNSVAITYTEDTDNPTNPTTISALNASGGSTTLTTSNWYSYATPYFSWSGASDGGSGIEGYWVYFGTSSSADPRTAGTWQTGATYTASSLSDGSTYYLRVLAKDKAENYPAAAWDAFTYKYDGTAPTPPAFVSVSPSGYSTSQNFTFLWPGSGSSAASDTGSPTTGSGVASYQYKTGAASGSYSSWSTATTETQIALTSANYQDGSNTFYLRVIDNAGNTSSEVTATYYYAGNAPSAPQNLSATPATSESNPATTNALAFSWSAPATYSGSIKQYRYSVNVLSTATNTTISATTSLSASSYATQQGKNTLYVVAEDEAGNINYNLYASVDFYAVTAAPGIPGNVIATDSSSRTAGEYRLTITWSAPTSGGTVSQYLVKRSLDGTAFEQVDAVNSTGYIDSGLTADTTYYYKIYAQDSAGSTSADPGAGGIVSKKPTGKYASPPTIDQASIASSASATSVTITWTTDRKADSFVEYGPTTSYGSSFGAREEVTSHSVKVTGLTPGGAYHFRVQSLDPGDVRDYSQSLGYSNDYIFTTTPAPALANVSFSDITTSSAIVSFETNKASSSTIEYGTSTNYGQTITDSSGGGTTKHTIRFANLLDGATYQVKITIKDNDNNEVVSPGHAFTTIALPRISDVRFESLPNEPETSVKVTWTTNVAASGYVEYEDDEAAKKEISSSKYETSHELIVRGLLDQSAYRFQAGSRDQFGNEVKSEVNTINTPLDSRPPQVKNLTIEVKSSGFGETQKAQIVAMWETDEPASSQIEFGPGISGGEYPNRTKEDAVLTTSHVVIASELEPSKIYHLRAISKDSAGNGGFSEDTTVITGKIQNSVLDVIVNSLERSLGWLFRMF
ncbi:MAG: fibronectin type III domain-containing protein [Patescibacteria group bacterium]